MKNSQSVSNAIGCCSVCHRDDLRIINTTGLLYSHGPRGNFCAGSHTMPIGGSVVIRTKAANAITDASATSNQISQHSTDSQASASVVSSAIIHPTLNGPIIKWIPKSARRKCASLLNDLLKAVILTPDSVTAWSKLVMFAPAILSRPAKGETKNLTNIISERLTNFVNTPIHQNNSKPQPTHVIKSADAEDIKLAKSVSSKLEEGNYKGAVRLLCSGDVPAAATEFNAAALRLKHPSAPVDRRSVQCSRDSTSYGPLTATVKEVRDALLSFPAGSSGGPDGLTAQHLKDMVYAEGELGQLITSLTQFVNVLLKGNVPAEVTPIFFGGRLIALSKKDGGLRPIAVGYTLRRLAAKVANTYACTKLADFLSPLQLGVGTAGGMEAAVHATRQYLQHLSPDHLIAKLDFKNAFNSVRRDAMLETIASTIPELFPFVHAAYSDSSVLKFGSYSIDSNEGVQQGDPLGPLLFSLTIHSLLVNCESDLRIGYLDDITLGGLTSMVTSDVSRLKSDAAKLGLELNVSKSEIISAENDCIIPTELSNFVKVRPSDAMLLGSPLSTMEALTSTLSKRINDLKTATKRLRLIHSHDALVILRHSLSLPSLLHNLRSAPCFGHYLLEIFDNTVRESLSEILNQNIKDHHWQQASLPVRNGGLGIRSACQLAPSAFLASLAGTAELVSKILPSNFAWQEDTFKTASLETWQHLSQTTPPDGPSRIHQRSWDSPIIQNVQSSLLASLSDDIDQARLKAVFSPHAGDWLNAPPITSIGLRLDDESLRVAVGLRLGTSICSPHECPCGAVVDARGTHGLSCRRSAGRHLRHNLINDIIWRALRRANIAATKEPAGLIRADGKRPDGATVIPWARGKCLAWDATIPDTLAMSHLSASSLSAGTAATHAAEGKKIKYAAIAHSHIFMPVAVETLGSWDSEGLNFIKELGRRVSTATGDLRETSFLLQGISVAIQRGNAASFAGSLPGYGL